MNSFPSAEDYVKAVQHQESFTSDELRRAEFVVDRVWRVPKPAAGTSAVVFKALVDGEEQALRFFIRPDVSNGDRYGAIQEHIAGRDLTSCVAVSRWFDDAIRINGRLWPVLRMEWVNGRPLNQHVESLVEQGDTAAIGALATEWRALVRRLQDSEFAHGDLQHGNVLVDRGGALRLVDFDCSWITRFHGQPPPTETGHRNYQPEGRPWGPWMDTFPGLLVYTSLVALSKNPLPWDVLNDDENMLFRREDFVPPHQTPAWWHMASIRDDELDQLAGRLRECCVPGWSASTGLEDLLRPRERPWWERTGRDPAATPPPPPPPLPPLPPPAPDPPTAPGPRPVAGEWWAATGSRPEAPEPVPGPRVDVAGRLLVALFVAAACFATVTAASQTAIAGAIAAVLAGIVAMIMLSGRR